MKFRKPYEQMPSQPTCCGETTKPVYTLVNRNGERSLKQVDEVDIPAYINSYEGETDIRAMLKRYSLTGDISILGGRGNLVYENVASCETNLAKLIESTREIALLKLQVASSGKEVSEKGKESAEGVSDQSSQQNGNIPNTEKTEVNAHE